MTAGTMRVPGGQFGLEGLDIGEGVGHEGKPGTEIGCCPQIGNALPSPARTGRQQREAAGQNDRKARDRNPPGRAAKPCHRHAGPKKMPTSMARAATARPIASAAPTVPTAPERMFQPSTSIFISR